MSMMINVLNKKIKDMKDLCQREEKRDNKVAQDALDLRFKNLTSQIHSLMMALQYTKVNMQFQLSEVTLYDLEKLLTGLKETVRSGVAEKDAITQSEEEYISKYILDNRDNYVFSALAASIDGKFSFKPNKENKDIGVLDVSMDARFLINDGQHRKAAILEALKEDETLENETIPIVFFEDKGLTRSQQIFTDLNKNAVKTSNSISELYDSRDTLAVITRNVVNANEFLNAYTDKERDILGKYSSNLFTLNTFYTANKYIFQTAGIKSKKRDEAFLERFWNSVAKNMVQWHELQSKEITKVDLRENYIATQGIVIQALGRVGRYFFEHPESNIEEKLKGLRKINWKRNAKQWQLRAIRENGRIITNKHAAILIANMIKEAVGIPLTDDEKSAEENFKKIIVK